MAVRRGSTAGRIAPVKTGARRKALKARPGNVAVTPRVQVAEMQRARLARASPRAWASAPMGGRWRCEAACGYVAELGERRNDDPVERRLEGHSHDLDHRGVVVQ